ncbi:MAG TPA: response regulator transcription factor [Steroidobacteraceae bacterium]
MSATPALPLTIAVLADSPIVRQRLINTLRSNENFVGIDGTLRERARPDVMLIYAGAAAPAEALRRADDGAAGVVLLTSAEPSRDWLSANGHERALAVIPRAASAAQIIVAVTAVAAGLSVFAPQGQAGARITDITTASRRATRLVEALSARETVVLTMIAAGLSNKVIADELGITGHTVKYHVASIFGKLGVASRAEAVLAGIQAGLILV